MCLTNIIRNSLFRCAPFKGSPICLQSGFCVWAGLRCWLQVWHPAGAWTGASVSYIFIPKGLSHSPKSAPPPPADLQAPRTCLDWVAIAKLNLIPAFPRNTRVKSVQLQIKYSSQLSHSPKLVHTYAAGIVLRNIYKEWLFPTSYWEKGGPQQTHII